MNGISAMAAISSTILVAGPAPAKSNVAVYDIADLGADYSKFSEGGTSK